MKLQVYNVQQKKTVYYQAEDVRQYWNNKSPLHFFFFSLLLLQRNLRGRWWRELKKGLLASSMQPLILNRPISIEGRSIRSIDFSWNPLLTLIAACRCYLNPACLRTTKIFLNISATKIVRKYKIAPFIVL